MSLTDFIIIQLLVVKLKNVLNLWQSAQHSSVITAFQYDDMLEYYPVVQQRPKFPNKVSSHAALTDRGISVATAECCFR